MTNPLVATPQDSTTAVSGVPLLESATDLKSSVESGDWASVAMGAVGTAMDAVSFALDPFGSIFAAGVGWLMEHVEPLKEALDALAGDPDEITAHADTWQNVAGELGAVSADLDAMVVAETANWTGKAGDAYRRRGADTAALIAACQQAADGASSGTRIGGEVVTAVRTLVRDTIAELIGRLISWALQVLATAGIGMTWVLPQVISAVAKTATRIADITSKLVKAMSKLGPLMKQLSDVFDEAAKALRKIEAGKTGPAGSPGGLKPGGGEYSSTRSGVGGTSASGSGSGPPAGGPAPSPPPKPPIPNSAHDHMVFGNVKPPSKKNKKKPTLAGGHMLSSSIPSGYKPTSSGVHGNGVSSYGTVTGTHPTGIHTVDKPQTIDASGKPVGNKPMSTVFPDDMHPATATGLGNQAWHNSSGPAPGGNKWANTVDIRYTPVWNPGHPDHGSGASNHPSAGQTMDMEGWVGPTGDVTSYYPKF